jgi:hypothetical protein
LLEALITLSAIIAPNSQRYLMFNGGLSDAPDFFQIDYKPGEERVLSSGWGRAGQLSANGLVAGHLAAQGGEAARAMIDWVSSMRKPQLNWPLNRVPTSACWWDQWICGSRQRR